jgi:exopolysaccharide biosynthesis polyprenyl glycosylphosphotransferase
MVQSRPVDRRSVPWALIAGDMVLVNAAFALSYYLRYRLELFRDVDPVNYVPYSSYLVLQLGYVLVVFVALTVEGAWRPRRGASWLDEVYTIANGTTTAMVVVLVLIFGIRPLAFSRLLLLYVSVLTVVFLGAGRLVKRSVETYRRRRGIGVDRTLIVGSGEVARTVMRTLVARPDLGYQLVGFVESTPGDSEEAIGRFPRLGNLKDLTGILKEHLVTEVIITVSSSHRRQIQQIIRHCHKAGARARIVPDFFQLSLQHVDVDNLGGIPLIGIRDTRLGRGPRMIKRGMDILGGVVGLAVFSPLIGAIALAIRLDGRGPIFFRQERLGEKERPFEVIKFRSMRVGAEAEQERLLALNEADGPLFKMRDDPRLTRVGRWIRRASLDELPQFVNVLRGEMSLVGPRPPLSSEVARYQGWQRKRLSVKPGITGLWQVSGRSDLAFDEMCLLDIYYIENWSLWLDVRIILRTIPQFFLGRGAY